MGFKNNPLNLSERVFTENGVSLLELRNKVENGQKENSNQVQKQSPPPKPYVYDLKNWLEKELTESEIQFLQLDEIFSSLNQK
jgi:hypothetical protein